MTRNRATVIIPAMTGQLHHRLAASWLLLVFALTACNFQPGQPEPLVVMATPSLPQATATSLPPPTPTPAPTLVPDVALRTAQQHLVNGHYENAVATFQVVLVQPPGQVPVEVRAAAAYGLGEAALREGLFQEAASALTNFLAQYPADSRIPWAFFLRGDAFAGIGQWAAAILDYEQYLSLRSGVIDSYVYERIADAYLVQNLTTEALSYYEQAINAGRGLVPLLALRERIAQVYLNIGQPQAAVAQYSAILEVAQNAGYRAEIMWLSAQAALSAGNPDAYEQLTRLMSAYPETDYAYQALQVLLEAGVSVEPPLQGQISYAAEDYEGAIAAFHAYTGELALSDIPVNVHLTLGRAYRAVGNTAAALTSFQTIVELFPTDPAFGEALLERGRTVFLSGDSPGAIERYQFLADTYPSLPQAPEALWRVGYLYDTLGQSSESLATFERLGMIYPGNEWANDGLLRAAMAAVNRNDLTTAERVLAALGTTGSGADAAAAYLWLGKLAQQNGRAAQAESAYRAAAAADPGGYFSIRAEDLLQGQDIFQPPATYRFEFDDQTELTQAENWLRTTFGIAQEGVLWPLSSALEVDPRVVAGRELWALLAVYEAGDEFSALLDEFEHDPLASYQLAIWLRSIGAYSYSITGAANVIKQANMTTLQVPAYLARMRYPAYYLDLVIPAMQARGLDPLLLLALIRQESLFDRYATAAAGEKGLTQVIPSTGDYIASRLEWPDYHHAVLFRPYASIAFGAYYLWEQISRFDFNTVVGLAAYNAGPGNASTWLATSGSDPDFFVEAIGFESTQLYVRRIYEHYHTYRRLYGAG